MPLSLKLHELLALAMVCSLLGVFLHDSAERRDAAQRSAALNGLAGMVRSSAALAHSVWVSDGASAGHVALADGLTIDIDLQTGFPRAADGGITALLPELDGIAGRRDNGSYVFWIAGVPAAECHVTYTAATVSGQPPRVTVRTNANGGDCS